MYRSIIENQALYYNHVWSRVNFFYIQDRTTGLSSGISGSVVATIHVLQNNQSNQVLMKLKSHTINVGYPVYGASFANDHTVIVAGGGGDGNNGIPNKMTAILVQPENTKKPLKRYRELTLNENEDSVMSMDYGNGVILAGINENPLLMAKGVNKHLRKFRFENEHLKFVESIQIHPNASSNIYQKITMVSMDGSVGVIVMSDTPSSVYIIDCSGDLEEKFKVVADGDVKDISISQDGKLMCYITASDFEVISIITGRSVFKTKLNFIMSKVRFLDNNDVIIAGCKDNGVYMAKFSIAKSKVVQEKAVFKNIKGVTSMDVNINNNLTALATSSYSLLLVRTSDFKVIKVLNKVHEFAITKVAFSGNGKFLASCSAANTVNVIEIPDNLAASKSLLATVFQYIISIILIAILSVSFQYLYENGYVNVAMEKVQEIYDAYKPQDSSSYFTVESIASFESQVMTSASAESTFSSSSDFLASSTSSWESFTSNALETPLSEVRKDFEEKFDSITSAEYVVPDEASTDLTSSAITSRETPETAVETIGYEKNNQKEATELESETNVEVSKNANDENLQDYTLNDDEIRKSGDKLATDFLDEEEALTTTEVGTAEASSSKETAVPILKSELFTSEIPTSTSTKEYTKELTKEVTSVVVSTSVEIFTSIETSTSVKMLTEVETSTSIDFTTSVDVSTAVETSVVVSTQIVVQTIVKEITLDTTTAQDIELSLQIEPTSTIFDDPKSASAVQESMVIDEININDDLSNVTMESNVVAEPESLSLDNMETVENSTVATGYYYGEESLGKEINTNYTDNDNATIQILPDFEVFDDPKEAIKEEERKIHEEFETHGEEFNIQIEPERDVFVDEALANEEQERMVVEELLGSNDTTSDSICVEDETLENDAEENDAKGTDNEENDTVKNEETVLEGEEATENVEFFSKNEENTEQIEESDLKTALEEQTTAVDISSLKSHHDTKHHKLDIKPITPIVRLQQETPDAQIPEKDEL